jgi:hypothetical protein
VDPSASQPPIKVWLLLGLLILMLHLAALRALPMHLGGQSVPMSPLSFETRVVMNQGPTPIAPEAAPTQRIRKAPSPPIEEVRDAGDPPETSAQTDSPPSMDDTLVPDANTTVQPEETAPISEAAPEPLPPPSVAPRQLREAATNLSTDVIPASIKLIYEVQANKFPYTLNGELVWIHAKGGYQASLTFGAFGLKRSQTSRGQIGPEGLMPERFSDKFRSELAAHFNRQLGKVTFSANTPDMPLLAGAQDRLSVLIQLAAMAASAPDRFTSATTLTIQTVGPRDADLWLFTIQESEPLTLPGGTLEVVKLTRNPRQAYDQQVDIWLAPSLGYLPARIRITESSGDYVDLKWLRSEPARPS